MDSFIKPKNNNRKVLSRKTWVAYAEPCIAVVMGLIVGLIFTFWLSFIPFLYAIYKVIDIPSYELFFDEKGVWLYSGAFPWNQGVRGVKWRDLDVATFYPNFFSWAMKSYTLDISHRYTKKSEINESYMSLGVEAIEQINLMHQQMIDEGIS